MKILGRIVMMLLFGGCVGVIAWNMATSDDIKALRDSKVAQVLPIPNRTNEVADNILRAHHTPYAQSGNIGDIKWKLVILDNGLECIIFKEGNHTAAVMAASCNYAKWEKYHGTQKEGES